MKTQSFMLLLAFVLVGNVLAAQGKYEYIIISNGGVKNGGWLRSEHSVSRDEEKNLDKLEVQKIDWTYYEKPITDGFKSMEKKGWEVFHVKDYLFYLRKPKN